MSDAAGGSAGAGSVASTSTTNVTPGSSTSESSAPGSQTKTAAEQTGAQGAEKQGAQAANKGGEGEEFEEIKVGSVSGKVPKQIAAMIKNLERGFQTKAQEAASKEKLLSLARENPKEFYKQTGKDVYDFAEEVLAEKYELMNMSEEQRELKRLKEEKAEREKHETASKQQVLDALKEFGPIPKGAENATRDELIQYYNHQKQVYANTQSSLDAELGAAFKESGLAADRHLIAKVAFEMSSAIKRGKSLSAKEAIAKVSNEYYSGAKQTFGNMDVKRIHEIFGDEFLEKVRKYDLEQVTSKAASHFGQSSQSPGPKPASEEPKKFLNQSEWRKAMGIT